MSNNLNGRATPDRDTYLKNRYSYPLDEIARLVDQWVAWSADGTRIVAHGGDLVRVTEELRKAGLSPDDVNIEFIPPDGEGGTQI